MINIYESDNLAWIDPNTNNVYLPKTQNRDDYISRVTIRTHTDTRLWVLWETVHLVNKEIFCKGQWLDYTLNEKGIVEGTSQDVGFALDWWAYKVQGPEDFEQTPHNESIHEYLSGREPLYRSEKVWITATERTYFNVAGWGWVSTALLPPNNASQHMREELEMAQNVIEISS